VIFGTVRVVEFKRAGALPCRLDLVIVIKHLVDMVQKFGNIIGCLILLLVSTITARAQSIDPRSARYGIDLVFSEKYSKDEIFRHQLFDETPDTIVNVLRLDNVGTSESFPLIVSSKYPTRSNGYGLNSVKLSADSLSKLLVVVKNLDTKQYKKVVSDGFCFRITYRFNQETFRYFMVTKESATAVFKEIERHLQNFRDEKALLTYYRFLYGSRLVEATSDKTIRWKY
jgi:hypothetical protein